jgi:hypothetical protein
MAALTTNELYAIMVLIMGSYAPPPHFKTLEVDMTIEQINNNFTYHAPKDDQQARYESLRSVAKDLAVLINSYCKESREKSLAMTKLEEAVMWANASIARNE